MTRNWAERKNGKQVLEMPSKPNQKTRLTNQLRLNSKSLFDPSLKEQKPILIEYQDTSRFTNMEKMAIHTLKEMVVGKTKKKRNKGHTSCIKPVYLETKYIIGPDPEQDLVETGQDAEKDFEYRSPDSE